MRLPALALVLLLGCDDGYGAFFNTVPIADQHPGRPTQVFIGIDGLSREAFARARTAGAFRDYHAADLITFFPGVSDYSWNRILRTGTTPGYESQYYDPQQNTLVKAGLPGLIEHPLRQGLVDPLPCYGRFDFLGDGETWMLDGYTDPEAALPATLDALFSVLATRGRYQDSFLAYLMNVDVISHHGGLPRAVAMLVEIDRRITEFKKRHPGRFTFTLLSDHGNAHQRATLIDPRDLLREVGVTPVETLGGSVLEAIPIVHVRVNFVSVHTRPAAAGEVAARASRHATVDLAAARLGPDRFAVFRGGIAYSFTREASGDVVVEQARAWSALGIDLDADSDGTARLDDAAAFAATADGRYPDLFHRVATAFVHPSVRFPPEVILSLRDDVASFGFHLPGSGDHLAVDGFHGALSRASTLSVVASEAVALPPLVRADDLATMFPALRRR
jgi:hypothetical protein